MECELCGKHIEEYYIIEVEGARLKVCSECKKYGKVISYSGSQTKRKPEKITHHEHHSNTIADQSEYEIVPNYGELIKKTREEKGLTQKQLAKLLNEKESVVHKLEIEEIEPNEKLIKKIENTLKIKLKTKNPNYNYSINDEKKSSVLTLGDLIKIKK